MAGRAGRAGPAVTRTQLMRQAKSSAVVRDTAQQQQATGGCPSRKPRVPKLSRRGPAPPSPKKIDFKKPGLTKAMLARMQHAKKFQSELDKKCDEVRQQHKRKPPPVGGDARMGRERIARGKSPCPPRTPAEQQWQPPSPIQMSPRSKAMQRMMQKSQGSRKATSARSPAAQGIPAKTCQLAKRMNADVIQADPVGDGPIDSVVIPPGTINQNCTTIVSINQGRGSAASPAAHRSMQMLHQSLDEQDAVESAAVQEKLDEMHQARRDLVMAVANIGGNTAQMAEQASRARSMPAQEGVIYKLPDINSEILRPKYGKDDNPAINAAREFRLRMEAEMRQREIQREMEKDFAEITHHSPDDALFDLPDEPEYLYESEASCEEEEELVSRMTPPCPTKQKTCLPSSGRRRDCPEEPIPTDCLPSSGRRRDCPEEPIATECPPTRRRRRVCPDEPIGIDELERFFDLENYPPSSESIACVGPPPGREGLHPDLWELDDPWVRQPDGPDLMIFDDDLIDFNSY